MAEGRIRFNTINEDELSDLVQIGNGSYATVLRGRCRGSDVAIKRARARITAEEVLQEVEMMRSLTHPNVLGVLGVVVSADAAQVSIVMELATGGDLHAVLAKERHTLRRRCGWAHQAALGLAWIHGAGLIHRDFKPKNLLLMRAEGEDTVKVCDLGLSTWLAQRENHIPLTTVNYAPPELRLERRFDQAGDWWSFGISLVHIATCSMPFAGEEQSLDELYAQRLVVMPRLPDVGPLFPPLLAALVKRCLQERPEHRARGPEVVSSFVLILAECCFHDAAVGNVYSKLYAKHCGSARVVPLRRVCDALMLSECCESMLRLCLEPGIDQTEYAVDVAKVS